MMENVKLLTRQEVAHKFGYNSFQSLCKRFPSIKKISIKPNARLKPQVLDTIIRIISESE